MHLPALQVTLRAPGMAVQSLSQSPQRSSSSARSTHSYPSAAANADRPSEHAVRFAGQRGAELCPKLFMLDSWKARLMR